MGPVRLDGKGDILDPRYDINMWRAGNAGPIGSERTARRPFRWVPAQLHAVSAMNASTAHRRVGVSHCGACPAPRIVCTAPRHKVGMASDAK